VFGEDTPLNYAMVNQMEDFKVPQYEKRSHPTAAEVEANKHKWGWTG